MLTSRGVITKLNFYLDFSTFGPHGSRLLRKQRLCAVMPQSDGTWRKVEMMGPPTYGAWKQCEGVAETAIVKANVMDLGTWQNYAGLIETYFMTIHSKVIQRCAPAIVILSSIWLAVCVRYMSEMKMSNAFVFTDLLPPDEG